MHTGVDYILLNKLILYNKNPRKCASVFFSLLTQLVCINSFTAADIQEKALKDLRIFLIAHCFPTVIEPRFSPYTGCLQQWNNLSFIETIVELTLWSHVRLEVQKLLVQSRDMTWKPLCSWLSSGSCSKGLLGLPLLSLSLQVRWLPGGGG